MVILQASGRLVMVNGTWNTADTFVTDQIAWSSAYPPADIMQAGPDAYAISVDGFGFLVLQRYNTTIWSSEWMLCDGSTRSFGVPAY